MPEAVLAGVDPSQPAIDQLTGQPLTIEELLRRRGLLAAQGRYTMFPGSSPTDVGTSAPQSAAAAQIAANNGGASVGTVAPGGVSTASPGVVASTAPTAANNAAQLPVDESVLDGMDEGAVTALLTGLGLGGAALAAYLLRRRAKMQPTDAAGQIAPDGVAAPRQIADGIPLVEGEVLPPVQRAVGDHIVDGEVVQERTPITNTKKIAQGATVPDNEGPKALGAPKQVDLPKEPARVSGRSAVAGVLTDQRKPDRRARARAVQERNRRTQPNDVDVMTGGDAMSDLSTEEKAFARSLVDQLKQNRLAGNAAQRRRMTGKRSTNSSLPSGTVNDSTLLNNVVRMIRQAKLKPSQLRVAR